MEFHVTRQVGTLLAYQIQLSKCAHYIDWMASVLVTILFVLIDNPNWNNIII